MLPDAVLVRRSTTGDERALAAIYGRYHQRIYRYCLGIVGNPEDARDALQNTMLKAMRALPGESREIELKPWLYRIAHNESIDLVRGRTHAEPLDSEQPARDARPEEMVQRAERLQALLADVGELPARQRGALVMRELAGLGFEEIAEALETSPATVRQTLYEARIRLREMQAGRELSCEEVTRALSDADGRVPRRRDVRAHLRACPACRAFGEEIGLRRSNFASIAPLPATASAAILHGLLGGHGWGGGSAGGGLGAAAGAGKAAGAAGALKAAAAVAVVAAIGVGAADHGGLFHVAEGGGGAGQGRVPAGSGGDRPASAPAEAGGQPEAARGGGTAAVGGLGPGLDMRTSARGGHHPPPAASSPAGTGKRWSAPDAGASPTETPPRQKAGRQTGAEKQAEHHPRQAHGGNRHGAVRSAPKGKGRTSHATATGRGHAGGAPHPAKPAPPAKPSDATEPSKAASPSGAGAGGPAATGQESGSYEAGGRKAEPGATKAP